jgi:hypothetical protein
MCVCVCIYTYAYILGYILEFETEDLEQNSRRACHTIALLLLYCCITDCFTTADRGPGAEYTPPLSHYCITTALFLYYCFTDCFTTAVRGPGAEYTPPL